MVCGELHCFSVKAYHVPVYDIPKDILSTLKLKEDVSHTPTDAAENDEKAQVERIDSAAGSSTSCALCSQNFASVEDQRSHVRSDLHSYNLKQRMRNAAPVTENEFETLVKDLDESLSGSDDSGSEDDESDDSKGNMLSNLLRKQATIKEDYTGEGRVGAVKTSGKAPLLWFETPALPKNHYLGVYRALFPATALSTADPTTLLRQKQLPSKVFLSKLEGIKPEQVGPHIFMLMIGGGHFAAMVVALSPAKRSHHTGPIAKEAVVICHKTFHRYTTRRKQGGSQSANDSAKGAAHSAGAGIRRYNEAALKDDVRGLLREWREMIDTSELCLLRATGTENRRTIFGEYEGRPLAFGDNGRDERVIGFPFNTRRATQKELMRAFIELTRVKIKHVDEVAIAAAKAAEEAAKIAALEEKAKKSAAPVRTAEDEAREVAELHTQQITALVKRSKLPALLQYLTMNELDTNFKFRPQDQHFHAPTPLHLAASLNAPVVVTGLLVKAKADPTVLNGEGRPPYDLAGDRPTRDAFRLARHKLEAADNVEAQWDWEKAHIPEPLSESDIKKRNEDEAAEERRAEEARRKAETERLKVERPKVEGTGQLGKEAQRRRMAALGAAGKTAEDKRREEMKGLSPDMRMKLERERRARAAEERFKKMKSGEN